MNYTTEHTYRMQERIGIMAGSSDPTPRQVQIAKIEADEAVAKLREMEKYETKTKLQP